MAATFNREDLYRLPGMTPRLQKALEQQQQTVSDTTQALTENVAATEGINNATVITLSANDAFANERILAYGFGLALQDNGPGGNLTLRLLYPIKTNGGYRCTFNLQADTDLTLPTEGTVATTVFPGPYADDATAASNGVAVGEAYRSTITVGTSTRGVIAWRQN